MLDVTTALVVEVYRELGMKFDEAIEDLDKQLVGPDQPVKQRPKPPPDDSASMALLQAAMAGSSFKGPKG